MVKGKLILYYGIGKNFQVLLLWENVFCLLFWEKKYSKDKYDLVFASMFSIFVSIFFFFQNLLARKSGQKCEVVVSRFCLLVTLFSKRLFVLDVQ